MDDHKEFFKNNKPEPKPGSREYWNDVIYGHNTPRTMDDIDYEFEVMNRPIITGSIPKRYFEFTEQAKPLAKRLSDRLKQKNGLVILSGVNGTGKSILAASVAMHWEARKKVYWTDTWDLLEAIKATFESKKEWEIPKHDLMIIDEFEKFNGTEWSSNMLDRTVCKRFDNMLPTLIVTNSTKEELNEICTGSLIRRVMDSEGLIELTKPYWKGGGNEFSE